MQMRVTVSGTRELSAALERMNPGKNKRIMRNSLLAAAKDIQANVALKQIRRRGKAKPLPHALSSRHGGSGITGSIRVNRGPLPLAIEVGTDKAYGPVHEFGGRVVFGLAKVKSHKRSVAFGKKVKPFTVPSYIRSGYSAKYPKRAYLKPGLDAVAPTFGKIVLHQWRKEARL